MELTFEESGLFLTLDVRLADDELLQSHLSPRSQVRDVIREGHPAPPEQVLELRIDR